MSQPALIDARAAVKVPMWARAREYSDEVVRFWAGMMRNTSVPDAVRLRASENLADRAWGKAPMIVLGDEAGPARINIAVLGAEDTARLEDALMMLVGDAIQHAPGRNASLDGVATVSTDSDIAASDALKANDSCTIAQHHNNDGTNHTQVIDNNDSAPIVAEL